LHQEFLPWSSGCPEKEKGERELQVCGMRVSMSRDKALTTTRNGIFQGKQNNIYVHTSRFGKILMNKKMTGWTPKLT
jgi:hypothetical protein